MTRAKKLMPVAGVPPKIGRLGRFVLRLRPPSRRFHAYCIGTSKSGTHSVAEIFGRRYRAAHEPGVEQLIDMMLAASSGKASQSQLVEFVRSRDSRLRLELECSHPLFHILDVLLGEFDEARFILTIRDCYSWLDSQINSQLSYIEAKHWQNFGEFKYLGESVRHPEKEQIFAQFGLYTLDGYLSAWASHNQKVLTTVPRDRLLVVRTQDIAKDLPKLGDFLGVPVNNLDPTRAHSFKGGKKFSLLSKLDQQYLEEKVNKYCRTLMDAYFPQVENFSVWHSARRRTLESAFARDRGIAQA
ncbi:MAG TPA: sulfotransferase [Pyrinomonadaceae bacterium]|nr:sulfotransferase [Pyrinomonadaceae bacterium]